ncbi:VanZ family protein [Streptococcus downei]|uniref:VanZF-related protein n=1 Tax=Streptococcus downei MFe28 TaxID=764290 RepID=A0A380JEZ0_STRDO|nr:VanZ family protein [Streptococcus downei]EFQ56751.1 VanZ-like protein [Streptococcus downei F0415]SUN35967.1 VanZF-related protein [Streptococcus downei MFe28]
MAKLVEKCFAAEAELTATGRRLVYFLIAGYSLCLLYLCFSPQPIGLKDVDTPNIHYWGQVPYLLVPFNSFVSIGKLDTFKKLFWVIGQNFSNLLLLTPLVLGILALKPTWRRWPLVLAMSFGMSLGIETTQVILDWLFNANRVFEVDDLIFNSLGGLLALGLVPVVKFLVRKIKKT